jgi:WD40 repeat protein
MFNSAKDVINCIAFAKDGRMFATGSNDKSCVIWKFNVMAEKKV